MLKDVLWISFELVGYLIISHWCCVWTWNRWQQLQLTGFFRQLIAPVTRVSWLLIAIWLRNWFSIQQDKCALKLYLCNCKLNLYFQNTVPLITHNLNWWNMKHETTRFGDPHPVPKCLSRRWKLVIVDCFCLRAVAEKEARPHIVPSVYSLGHH